MSNDWLKEFNSESPSDEFAKSSDGKEKQIALDSLGIPILDEVVFIEEDYSFDEKDYSFDDEVTFHSIPEPTVEVLSEHEEPSLDPSFELPEDPEFLQEHLSELAAESKMEQESSLELSDESAVLPSQVAAAELSTPDSAVQFDVLRERLTASIKQELEAITETLARSIMDNLSMELEKQIRTSMKQTLDNSLDQMINQAIKDISDNSGKQ